MNQQSLPSDTVSFCRGIVKENTVVLETGALLPDGALVEVRLIDPKTDHPLSGSSSASHRTHDDAFARVLTNRITHRVGIDEIIEADKNEQEIHPDTWLKTSNR